MTEAQGHQEGHRPHELPLLFGLTLVVATCSIVYELVLAQTLSVLAGNTVLRYSLTIGCYLGALGVGAMLCGRRSTPTGPRLYRIEMALSLVGGLSVLGFLVIDAVSRYWYTAELWGWEHVVPWTAVGLDHLLIIVIGVLSGFEIPLLIGLAERMRAGSTNLVLGVDYGGSLVGSVLFPLVLLRQQGLVGTGLAMGVVNAIAAVVVAAWLPMPRRRLRMGLGVLVAAGLAWAWSQARAVELHFARKYYSSGTETSVRDLFQTTRAEPEVQRIHSPYQIIDLVRMDDGQQWFTDLLSLRRPADAPRDLWLFLTGEFQLFSGAEEFYHEWFVHVPVMAGGRAPRQALVLGGGDGAAVRELVEYPQLERVVHVELDPQMIELATRSTTMRSINGGAYDDPRVELVNADAISWLRRHEDRFDAIFVDMPYARDESISMVYSREFYALVRTHLRPGGFMSLDAPSGECWEDDNLWAVYSSTLRAAGFGALVSITSTVPLEDPRLVALVDQTDRLTTVTADGRRTLEGAHAKAMLEQRVEEAWLDFAEHFFVIAYPERAPFDRWDDVQWVDMGLEHDALRPHLLADAHVDCPLIEEPDAVNSIFRPVLPELDFSLLRVP